MDSQSKITDVSDVPVGSTYVFALCDTGSDEEKEAILVRDNESVRSWLNYCQHFTHIKLDKGAGAEMRDGEIICTNHGAYFESDSGYCNFGPCEGAYLNDVEVTVADGSVYLTDDDYEFVKQGPIADDEEMDLNSKSNFEF